VGWSGYRGCRGSLRLVGVAAYYDRRALVGASHIIARFTRLLSRRFCWAPRFLLSCYCRRPRATITRRVFTPCHLFLRSGLVECGLCEAPPQLKEDGGGRIVWFVRHSAESGLSVNWQRDAGLCATAVGAMAFCCLHVGGAAECHRLVSGSALCDECVGCGASMANAQASLFIRGRRALHAATFIIWAREFAGSYPHGYPGLERMFEVIVVALCSRASSGCGSNCGLAGWPLRLQCWDGSFVSQSGGVGFFGCDGLDRIAET